MDLDGHAPTADLNLFKEARRVTEEMLVSLGHVTLSCDCGLHHPGSCDLTHWQY